MHCPTRPRIVQYMKYRFRKFPFQQQIVGERARFLQILDDQVLCKTLEIKTGQRGQPKSGADSSCHMRAFATLICSRKDSCLRTRGFR